VTFDKTTKTYTNLDMQVRPLPENHDSSDVMAAMAEAARTDCPGLGVLYREERPTLADALDTVIANARGGSSRRSGSGNRAAAAR
jgi:hypothetical protein